MPLKWSDPMPPDARHPYDRVEAATPIGRIVIEWKGWKDDASPDGEMPWGEGFWATDLDEAKTKAQALWDARMVALAEFNRT